MWYYQPRAYREWIDYPYKEAISYKSSDILICTDKPIDREFAKERLIFYYTQIEEYCEKDDNFLSSLIPYKNIPPNSPLIVKRMIESSQKSNVGPFSAVAGAIALFVGNDLLDYHREVENIILENGGDVFLKVNKDIVVGVYIGKELQKLELKIKKRSCPFGLATSSAYIGWSLNFGCADTVTVLADDAILADTFATAISNKIKHKRDLKPVLEESKKYKKIQGVLAVVDDLIGIWGDWEWP